MLTLAWGVPLACGPDARPKEPCGAEADFTVLISAANGALPIGTRVTVTYGSGREEYVVGAPSRPEILFCDVLDEEGVPIEPGAGGATGGSAGAGPEGEGGGFGVRSADGIAGLRCALWTQGPATIEIVAEGYPEISEDLRRGEGSCTLTKELVLAPEGDAGS
jgi:hypothetical protein